MPTTKEANRRLSLLEVEYLPKPDTHYFWADKTEAQWRKECNIPDYDEVVILGWLE